MPPKKLQSVIAKGTPSKTASSKEAKRAAQGATTAFEIEDIFSRGTIVSSTPAATLVSSLASTKKSGTKKESKAAVKYASAPKKTTKDSIFMTKGSDGDNEEDDKDDEELFDEEEITESEDAAIAKLMASKSKQSNLLSKSVPAGKSSLSGAMSTRSGNSKVEAVIFNERPAAAAAAAAAAKIQNFKRAREDRPDSDDELEKKSKRRTDDGLRLFDIHDLGIGKGGDTDLCPFDCECCF
ncbi:hypothetical protein BG004_002143 [Podila humilis]|nr:hypothetical protein BG004_002143 [Podila humilis]